MEVVERHGTLAGSPGPSLAGRVGREGERERERVRAQCGGGKELK